MKKISIIQGISWKKYPQLSVCTRDRKIVSIERVYTPSTLYMKSAVLELSIHLLQYFFFFKVGTTPYM